MQTPVQKAGYKIGQQFRITVEGCGFSEGQIVTLNRDDGSRAPVFKGTNSRYNLADYGNSQGAFYGLDKVEPICTFKVGDRVTVLRGSSSNRDSFYTRHVGKVGVITALDTGSNLDILVVFDNEDGIDWGNSSDAELAPAIVVEPTCTFKEGDRVRVVGQDTGFYSWNVGKEGEIVQLDLNDSLDVRVRFDDGDSDWGYLSSVELVSPEAAIKAATIKEKLAEIARLAAEVQEMLG